MKYFLLAALALSLPACAPTKGFIAGAVGGVPYVDELRHNEDNPNKLPTTLKVFGHETILISMAYTALWPLAAVYGIASGSYGAYHFWKAARAMKAEGSARQ